MDTSSSAWIIHPRPLELRRKSSSRATARRFGGGYDGRHADEEAAEYEKDGSFEKVDGS